MNSMTGKHIKDIQDKAAREERVVLSRGIQEVGRLFNGRLELYHADGSSFSHPVIAGRIVDEDDFGAMLARQKENNDAHDKVVDLSPGEWNEKRDGD